ncbi:hypothetical protein MAHJHV33_48670 [Mycobacterium avium subsp. hominissuis]
MRFAHRHRVDELIVEGGAAEGSSTLPRTPVTAPRGVASSRNTIAQFEFRADAVVVTSGGIGAKLELRYGVS